MPLSMSQAGFLELCNGALNANDCGGFCYGHNTGEAADGDVDRFWYVNSGVPSSFPFALSDEAFVCPTLWPTWHAPSPRSKWIAPDPSLTEYLTADTWVYKSYVSVPNINVSAIEFVIDVLADDEITDISINGASTGLTVPAPGYNHAPTRLTIPGSFFTAGPDISPYPNIIAVSVLNSGMGVTGFNLAWISCVAPESSGSGPNPGGDCTTDYLETLPATVAIELGGFVAATRCDGDNDCILRANGQTFTANFDPGDGTWKNATANNLGCSVQTDANVAVTQIECLCGGPTGFTTWRAFAEVSGTSAVCGNGLLILYHTGPTLLGRYTPQGTINSPDYRCGNGIFPGLLDGIGDNVFVDVS